MGYTTEFEGKFEFSRELTGEERQRLERVGDEDWRKVPNSDAPGYYCQWISEDGLTLEWDGNEKFYEYIGWLEWLIKKFFEPRGIKLNGEVEWSGEEKGDVGKIIVEDNQVTVKEGRITYD
jgi:hypothetical protein